MADLGSRGGGKLGVGNEGAGGGHAFRCYYHKANFKLNTAESNY
jgi:hypothetical protein